MTRVQTGCRVAALLVIALVVGVGCTTAPPAAQPAGAKPEPAAPQVAPATAPLSATMAVGNNLNHVPAFVGVEKGIFLKNGLDLKLKVLNTGVEMNKAMQAGEAAFAGASVTNTPLAREEGIPQVAVVGYMNDATTARGDSPLAVVARKEAGIGEGKIEALAGKKVGLAVGGTGDEYLRLLLKTRGVPDSAVTFINVAPGNQLSAIQNGSVDVISTWEPYGTQILEKLSGSVLVIRGGGYLGYVIMASSTEEIIKNQPELVKRFVAGVAEATQYARQNPDEAAEISTRWIPGLDVEVAKKAIRFMPFDARISKYSIQAFEDSVKVLLDQKKLKQSVSVADAINTTFIEQVMRERPELFSDLKPIPSARL